MSQTFIPYTECVICGSKDLEVLFTKEEIGEEQKFLDIFFHSTFQSKTPDSIFKDHIYTTHCYEANLIVCKNCGHLSRGPRLSPESVYEEYLQDEYHQLWMELVYPQYCKSFEAEMPQLVKKLGKKAHVLEIGSQLGGFLTVAQSYGWDVQGVDIGRCVTDFTRQKSLPVFRGSLFDAHFPDNTFDAVFVWLCFEMLVDPAVELHEIYRILKSGGLLLIDVPNADYRRFIKKILSSKVSSILRPLIWRQMAYEHVLAFNLQFGYSKKSIEILFGRNGFDNIQVRNQFYWPITVPQYVKKWSLIERALHLQFVNLSSEAIYYLTSRKQIIAPWILAYGYKP